MSSLSSALTLLRRLCVLSVVASGAHAAEATHALAPVSVPRSASFEIRSHHTGQTYRILIALPWGPAPAAGYPALWALDGAMSFPLLQAWRPLAPTDRMPPSARPRGAGPVDGLIVAIAHAQPEGFDVDARARDYTPPPDAITGDLVSRGHGGAPAFLRFLTEELRPRVAREFPLDAQRQTLFGFSYGGLFALHVLRTAPLSFQRYWIASPSVWFSERTLLRDLAQRLEAAGLAEAAPRIVLTVGQNEQYPPQFENDAVREKLQTRAMVDNATTAARLLEAGGAQVRLRVQPGSDHHDMLMDGARHVAGFAFEP
ncbi:MAG: alpha/beta hydrolase-fold protein [Candidatus Dactylopiibacterium sp.]|nr:alpha/beta hydrolase-fold protein [Candidatus Dactylopiibacterium sp.]